MSESTINRAPTPVQPITTGGPAPEPTAQDKQMVTVRALGVFHVNGDLNSDKMTTPGETFQTDRLRATQLRANGLVEFTSPDDDKVHADNPVVAARVEERKAGIADKNKSTPLRNPQLGVSDLKS